MKDKAASPSPTDASAMQWLRTLVRPLVEETLQGALAPQLRALVESAVSERLSGLDAAAGAEPLRQVPPRVYTREQACDRLGVSPSTFYRLQRKGLFRLYRSGRKVVVDASVIDSLLASGRFGK